MQGVRMYQQHSGFFGSHDQPHPIKGEEAAAAWGGHSLMGSGSSTSNIMFSHEPLDLNLNRQFEVNLKHELDALPHCSFDSAILSDPAILRVLAPATATGFHSASSDVFLAAECSSVASTGLYDPATVHLPLPDQLPVLPPLPQELYGGALVYEGYNIGQQLERSHNKTRKRVEGPSVDKHEKQRRERLSKNFDVLKSLIPNSTKPDRATIIADTINYISELLSAIDELKGLIEKKRRRRERITILEVKDEVAGDMESSSVTTLMDTNAEDALKRSSRSQRKSKDTHVDVRVFEDEVTIKLTQGRKNCDLLAVSRILCEMQLELLHLSGGTIGDCHIFLMNTKIHESSTVYADEIANKFIQDMDM